MTGNKLSRVGTLEDDTPECFLFSKRMRGGHVTPRGGGGAISSLDGRNDRCSRSDGALGSLGARVPPPRSHQRDRLPSQPRPAKGQKHRRRRSYPPPGDAAHRWCRRSQSGSSCLHRYLDDCGSFAARIAHSGGHYARETPDELLHAPKTAASQNRALSSPSHRYVSSLENNLTWFVSLALRGIVGSCVAQSDARPRQKTVDAHPSASTAVLTIRRLAAFALQLTCLRRMRLMSGQRPPFHPCENDSGASRQCRREATSSRHPASAGRPIQREGPNPS